MDLLTALILGLVQGVAEWLPISSEAMVILAATELFSVPAGEALSLALWLHGGTVLSVLIYFWSDIKALFRIKDKQLSNEQKFYLLTTVISVIIGGLVYLSLDKLTESVLVGSGLTILIGVALVITGLLLKKREFGTRTNQSLNNTDAIYLGLMQGLAVMPGISRSGSTSAIAFLRKFELAEAFKVSFLMGVPMMIIGIILLLLTEPQLLTTSLQASLVSLSAAALSGLITIKILLNLAKKINFSWFVTGFGILVLISTVIF